jgi:hypothetical protein
MTAPRLMQYQAPAVGSAEAMRRRGRSLPMGPYYGGGGHSTSDVAGYFQARNPKFKETPEVWKKHALEPWRILFPDLDWQPSSQDE